MLRIHQIRIPCGHPREALQKKIEGLLRKKAQVRSFSIVRHSVDARKKSQLMDVYTVDVETGLSEKEEIRLVSRLKNPSVKKAEPILYRFPRSGTQPLRGRIVVIGAGPAGLFCALFLAEHGYRPLLVERGKRMEDRTADVARFWETGKLDPLSNVQFGEGGAGTFSDGKLNTQINDRTGRSSQVLRIFAEEGAPQEILTEALPHIGTDRLRTVIPRIRRRIQEAGGSVLFETVCTGFQFEEESGHPPGGNGPRRRLTGIFLKDAGDPSQPPRLEEAGAVVLAVGHSARDTLEWLCQNQVPMEQKAFAVGLRTAHPQAMIDQSQYGFSDPEAMRGMGLSASPYKLTARARSGRGVYSFCMCPGGRIVNASSEEGRLCVNGMSDEGRDSGWANSAIVMTVGPEDYGTDHVLAGMRWQRSLEERAFQLGGSCVPVQTYRDLRASFFQEEGQKNDSCGSCPASGEKAGPEPKEEEKGTVPLRLPQILGPCRWAPVHTLLPPELTADFIDGMDQFGRKIKGFDGRECLVAGIESRTSSPVRILRGETLESVGVRGLYPCGEGAGYAGGIMSAAMDGIRVAEAIAARFAGCKE